MIELKKDIFEIIQLKNIFENNLITDKNVQNEIDKTLDVMNKINELFTKLKGCGDIIKISDYNNYINLLAEEKYEELKNYKIL